MHTTKSLLILTVLLGAVLFAQNGSKHNKEKYTGKTVVFFGPSQAEYDKLKRDDSSGIDEVLSDFQFYAGKIQPYLKTLKIQFVMTSAETIELKYSGQLLEFVRLKSGYDVGVILSDGVQKPKISFGVKTDDDLKADISGYFHRK